MKAYKLFRQLKNGDITSLFINKKRRLPFNVWMDAEDHSTKGFKKRPYWHCMKNMSAPHLTMKNRVWCEVEIKNYIELKRPENQGGIWFLAQKMMIKKIVNNF